MDKRDLFVDFEKNAIVNKLLDAYVSARERIKFSTNKKQFDEDVNVYISHLLFAFAMPNYSYITEQYISLNPEDIKMMVDLAEDHYFKYFIYKVNGDNLLLRYGLFDDLDHASIKRKTTKGMTDVDFKELAVYYYQKASQCNRRIHKRKTALSEVLLKLVKNFDQYAKALGYMRKEYYLFYSVFEDEEFFGFTQEVNAEERKCIFTKKQDEFLELYAKWMKEPTKELKKNINHLCKELHALDESFSFRIK